jgi:hypothetical protein
MHKLIIIIVIITMASVRVLVEGYAKVDEVSGGVGGVTRANCTSTLIISPKNVVIVDTLTPWDAPLLIQSTSSQ